MSFAPPPLPRPPSGWQPYQIASHLHALKVMFYVLAVVHVLLALICVMAGVGGYISETAQPTPDGPSPLLILLVLGAVAIYSVAMAVVHALAARRLGARQHHRYCMIAAGLACLAGALGIALAVYALLTLRRPEVRASFLDDDSRMAA